MLHEPYRDKVADVLHDLRVRAEIGLTSSLVRQRRERFGTNDLPTNGARGPWLVFLDRFKDVLVLVLLAAAVLSWLLGRAADSLIIFVALLLDAGLSFAQVWRTEKTLKKIHQQVQPHAVVLREGKVRRVAARDLVVGDVIEIRAGEKVPADARLIRIRGLRINEAALTGESADVVKQIEPLRARVPISNRINMVFMGTAVVNGFGRAVVVATGPRTEFGKIAQMLKTEVSPPSPLRRKLQRVGVQIGAAIIFAVGILFVIGLAQGKDLVETSLTAITLVVSAIPEDLTMILTIALTVGVARILKRKGAVRRLSSGETLGAATVICTDKTGTITRGVMQAENFEFSSGKEVLANDVATFEDLHSSERLALQALVLTSDARRIKGDGDAVAYIGTATERAALKFAEGFGIEQISLRKEWQQRSGISFSSQWKYRATLNDHPSGTTKNLLVVGAPEVLLERSEQKLSTDGTDVQLDEETRYYLSNQMRKRAGMGYRLLAVAVRKQAGERDIKHEDIRALTFLGFLMLRDPIREGVPKTVRETLGAGVQIKLVTGDHPATARTVAKEIGLPVGTVVTSGDLDQTSDAELRDLVRQTTVFARITPLDKQRIVKTLQANGEVVAMTGDGINDAVALKGADIGVAVGSGTEIAKEAADLILIDDSLETIVAAIREGRVLRDNLRKVLAFLLSTNAAEIAIFFVSLFFGLPLPLLPAQILWINLVTDGTSDIALSLEPAERNVMRRKPEDPGAELIGFNLFYHIVTVGLVITAGALGLYWYLLGAHDMEMEYVRTMIFTFVSFVSLLSVWSFRSLSETVWRRGIFGNKWVFVSLAISASLQLAAVYVPALQNFFGTVTLGWMDMGLILVVALISQVLIDLRKKIFIGLWQQGEGGLVMTAKKSPASS